MESDWALTARTDNPMYNRTAQTFSSESVQEFERAGFKSRSHTRQTFFVLVSSISFF